MKMDNVVSRIRFDPDLLDPEDPFEIDHGNLPHLFKHGFTPDDAYDVFWNAPLFYEGDEAGPADWLMTGYVPGNVLTVPLAPSRSRLSTQARPIGVYQTSRTERMVYERDRVNRYGR
jgi:hypothetical protein